MFAEITINQLGVVVNTPVKVINLTDLIPRQVMNPTLPQVPVGGDIILGLGVPEKGQITYKVSGLDVIFIYGH